jgi:hypothetical protein
MPRVSAFYGIVIWIHTNDHPPPHFHATYGEHEVLICIVDGSVYAGSFPRRGLRLVRSWRSLRVGDLQKRMAPCHPPAGPRYDRTLAMKKIKRIPKVTAVEVLDHYVLRVSFDDGLVRDVDLSGDLPGPIFEPLKDPEYFARVFIDGNSVAWPNGADVDPLVLHGDFEFGHRYRKAGRT